MHLRVTRDKYFENYQFSRNVLNIIILYYYAIVFSNELIIPIITINIKENLKTIPHLAPL